jgi:hypothetical protein
MAKRKGACWMCGQVGALSEEHAIPDWIREIFASEGNDIALSKRRVGIHESSRTWTNKSGEVTVRSICRPCNNGWMSRLECRCKPVLELLIYGHSPQLDSRALEDLALWAVKTAWMFQSMSPSTSTCTTDQRRALAEKSTIPASVQVSAGAFMESGEKVLCTNWYVAGSASPEGRTDSSTTTLLIGRIVFQVHQRPAGGAGVHPPTATRQGAPPHYVLTQAHGKHIVWPPGRPLRQEELEEFTHPPDFTKRPWTPLPPLPESDWSLPPSDEGTDG